MVEESLSTLYEAEEEPIGRLGSDDENDDVVIDSTTSSTLTVINQHEDSLTDVADDVMEKSEVTIDVKNERKGKKVYRRLVGK